MFPLRPEQAVLEPLAASTTIPVSDQFQFVAMYIL